MEQPARSGEPDFAQAAALSQHSARVGSREIRLAHVMLGYTRWVARRGSLRWFASTGGDIAAAAIRDRLVSLRRYERRLILSYFIEDALGVAMLAVMDEGFLALMRALTCVVDDTLAGRISAAMIRELGGQFALLPRPGDPERVKGVYEIIRQRRSCAFPVDGGGPYRQVGTGVFGLAASLNAAVVPIAATLRPALTFAPQSRVRVPTPNCRLSCAIGGEIRVDRNVDRRAAALQLKLELDALSAAVHAPRSFF